MEELLAKSPKNGGTGTTLLDHTTHVVEAMRTVANEYLPADKLALAVRGAVLHDLGKAHPFFQKRVRNEVTGDNLRDVPHRHELSSLLFLPLFPRDEWGDLIDMIVAHHKSVCTHPNDKGSKRGLLDLIEHHSGVFERHAEGFGDWQTRVAPVLEAFGIVYRPITLPEAREAWEFAVEHCEGKTLGVSEWRGVLMSADHLASALEDGTQERVETLFVRPDLSPFVERAETSDAVLYPLSKKSADDPRPHTLIVAPTGSGKTDLLLRRCQTGRVFYLLPFQASINAMYNRLYEELHKDGRTCDIRRLHAASRIEIERKGNETFIEEQVLQKHPGASVKVMTPHQVAAIVLGTSGHEAVMLDIRGQDVILDEIHVYGEQAQAMTLAIVSTLTRLGARVHIGSATIPAALQAEILRRLGGEESVYTVRLDNDELASYDRYIVHKIADETAALETVAAALGDGKRVLFLSNTVGTAQDRYTWAKQEFPDLPVLLLHSRYRRKDRAALEAKISVFDEMTTPCLVCATQVVEVSLDISFDTCVTDCAPLPALIQRFGRVNRRRTKDTLGTLAPVYVVAPPDNANKAKPYLLPELVATWAQLPDGDTLHETELQERIDAVYPTADISPISVHLAVDEATGAFRVRELTHRSKSLLVDMLEIDSAVCIRKSDEEAYTKARGAKQGETRMMLEIPVRYLSVSSKFPQLTDVGNEPFVVPDTEYGEEVGLSLRADAPRSSDLIANQFV
ncbi:MAG: CRISPR-associated helicase Cas3' [Fibrella sp.]|nr:CRISPR-associated helicase Cas3' [Armatimonadota bacterium]